jgi:pyruvate formate lyase activating enzyme
MYRGENCLHCLKCARTCPEKAITAAENGRIQIDFHKCTGCLACVQGCPGRALTSEGEYKTVDEVMEVCLQDIDFYEESGGGVTVSGGEGMAQPAFAEALVLGLKEKGVHTAIETTGCVSPEVFHRLAPLFDLLLFDVKHYDPIRHKTGTGVDTGLIHKNLRWAQEQGLTILPRIPVIPGFNADLPDAEGIADLLRGTGLTRVQLLPFHQMGERKYEFLNRAYEMTGVKALHPEDLTEYQKVFLRQNIDCFF